MLELDVLYYVVCGLCCSFVVLYCAMMYCFAEFVVLCCTIFFVDCDVLWCFWVLFCCILLWCIRVFCVVS